jgi:hypothetical protein
LVLEEVLEMLGNSDKALDIEAVVKFLKQLESVYLRLGVEADESDVLLDTLGEVCTRSEGLVQIGEQLESYRSKLRDKVVGRAELVKPVANKGAYLAQLVAMDDEQLFAELEKLEAELAERLSVPQVTGHASEFEAVRLVRLNDFKV